MLLNVFCPQYVMSYDAILCCDVLCCALLCYVVLCYVMLCDAILHYAMLCYAVLCYATVHYLFYLRLRESVAMGTLDKDAVVIAPVDRDNDRAWKQSLAVDALPTLTTHNRYLFILSVHCVVDESWLQWHPMCFQNWALPPRTKYKRIIKLWPHPSPSPAPHTK